MILVTGAKGGLGSYVERVFAGSPLTLTDVDTLDVADEAAVREAFERVKPSTVLHLGAETDVDRCEREPEHAMRVNARGTETLAKACAGAGAAMVYVSSGAVFRGDHAAPATEDDPPGPVSVYAKSKHEGELAVARSVERRLILRAGWMIGGGVRDKKFVYKMLKLVSERDRVQAVADKFGTLTYGLHLLKAAAQLLSRGAFGTYHIASPGVVTRYDVAVELARLAGRSVEVEAVGSDRFPLPAPRGRSEAIASARLASAGVPGLPPWREALAEYYRELEALGVVKGGRVVA